MDNLVSAATKYSSEIPRVPGSSSGHTTTRSHPTRLPLLQARIPLHLDDPKQRLKRLQPPRTIRHAAQVLDARLRLKNRAETLHPLGALLDLVRGDLGQGLGEGRIPGHVASLYGEVVILSCSDLCVSDGVNELYSRCEWGKTSVGVCGWLPRWVESDGTRAIGVARDYGLPEIAGSVACLYNLKAPGSPDDVPCYNDTTVNAAGLIY